MVEQPLRQFDVICAGLIVADHVCAPIRKIPDPGGLITTPKLQLAIGGCAANASVDLTGLGVSVALVGAIGHDPLGEFVLQRPALRRCQLRPCVSFPSESDRNNSRRQRARRRSPIYPRCGGEYRTDRWRDR